MWYNPAYELENFRRFAEGLFGSGVREDALYSGNLFKTEEGYAVSVPLPGVAKEDIDVNLEEGVLKISAKRALASREDAELLRHERRNFSFERSYRLPEDVDVEKISAEVSDGVLTLVIPQHEKSEPMHLQIEVK